MRHEEEQHFDNEQTVVTLGAPDLDRDLQYDNGSDVEEPVSKKPKWFEGGDDDKSKNTNDGFVEYDEPETLEDLESLTARLIGN